MNDFAIVAVGYNRQDCLSRLLNSLNNADYNNDRIPLIISIDNSGNDSVQCVAEAFKWKHGEKIIQTYPERLGLRNHILRCGDFTQNYDHIAIFEDDLYVSESFYHFAKQAIEFYNNDDRIAGIALYSHFWDQGSNRPFLPVNDQFDAYFMQYACSWGQIWSREKWNNFVSWYEKNSGQITPSPLIPKGVSAWPKSSWLKYHTLYCIEMNKFFVYPRAPLSTNFSSKGEHNEKKGNGYQVPLQINFKRNYIFPNFDESNAKYDAFFEFIKIGDFLKLNNDDICMDLYGMKKNSLGKPYWLTLEVADYKIIRSFDMSMRPHEMNVIMDIEGDIIKLYDTGVRRHNTKVSNSHLHKLIVQYDIKNIGYRTLLAYMLTYANERFIEKYLR